MKKSICTGLGIAVSLAVATPVLATASHSNVVVTTITVKYNADHAQTVKGAQVLYAKLRSAARDACTESSAVRSVAQWAEQKCAAAALDKAVEEVNLASLDALHDFRRGTVEVLASN